MTLNDLQTRKIVILGLGTNNRHLAEYLKKNQIRFDVLEWQSPDELAGKLDAYDLIFRTPGLPYLSKAIVQAKASGAEISSQTKLFFELCPAPIIGVTGTKGKGTTSSLIAAILAVAGRKAWLAGNIGQDPFEFLDQIKSTDWVIMELSSYQLEDMNRSPHLAVVLNITSDHLDYHKSQTAYMKAKTSILEFQTDQDAAFLHKKLPESFHNLGRGRKIFFDPASVMNFETQLLGLHNRDNIAAAAAVGRFLGIAESVIREAVSKFKPLPHRTEVLGTIRGITYIDDGVSTNIEPAMAAIDVVTTPLVLIVGGHDKGLDFTELGKKIINSNHIKGLVVVGQVTDKILKAAAGFSGKILTGARNMAEILTQARSLALPGDTVLISPATDSFDMFKNTYDRAEQFVSEVMKLK